MARKVTLYTAQWADMSLETICRKASEMGYDGLELACNDNHLNLDTLSQEHCDSIRATMKRYRLELYTVSNHPLGQCVCDPIDRRHKNILSPRIWGDGDPEGVRQRATAEMIRLGEAAKMLEFIETVVRSGYEQNVKWIKWIE